MRASFIASAPAVVYFLFGTLIQQASATTIDPLLWRQIANGAAFIGVVECEIAGGIVAEYRVVDSWKGASNDTLLRIGIATDYWGDEQFAIALCGERYLIAGFKVAPTSLLSTTIGGPVPLWWRRIRKDVRTPLFQGRVRLPLKSEHAPFSGFGSKHKDLQSFKADVDRFLAMSPVEQERELVLALCEKYMPRASGNRPIFPTQERQQILLELRSQPNCNALLQKLLGFAAEDSERWQVILPYILQQGGGATLKYVEQLEESKRPWSGSEQKRIVYFLRARLGQPITNNGVVPSKPDAEDLVELRKTLIDGSPTLRAIHVLSQDDPQLVVDYLTQWSNASRGWLDRDRGYHLGSLFGWRCGGIRSKHLNQLSEARNPFIQVAGAVYLCFEDQDAGMQKLRKLSTLPGDPGAWAALTLARRGDTSALRRALAILEKPAEPSMVSIPHLNLQKRVLVLLSNIAKRNDLPAPPINVGGKTDISQTYRSLLRWLSEHEPDIKSVEDPWMKELLPQKVD